jgi:ABC-type polysaccharide/polyol phosphate transport system ATPase subunit
MHVDALTQISLHLQSGDRLGLIGHNGAGKSTLLRILAGIYEPSVGKVNINGSIGAMLDITLGMDPEATGYENIRIRGMILGLSKSEIEQIIPDIEEFTEMGSFLSMPVKTYSSGMTVRLAFAISTAIAPDILLMDEAIGAGDAHFMEKAQKRLENFVHQSEILVLASHSNAAIRQFCNKALWLEHGRVHMFDDVETVVSAYENREKVTAEVV